MSVLTKQNDQRVARPLQVLVPLIQKELEAGDAAGVEHYRRAGEMLLEAKEQVGHGEWEDWLERNFHRSERTARAYMQLAKTQAKTQNGGRQPFSTLSQFIGDHRTDHEAPWSAPVKKIVAQVDTEMLNRKKEEMKRAEEREAERKLALQLIDIGYKVLARKLHPDRGGSKSAMARLNAVRDRLKHCV